MSQITYSFMQRYQGKLNTAIKNFVASRKVKDLNDVAASSPSDGDVLKFNANTNKWENQSGGTVINSINDISDVDITNVSNGQLIKYNSSTQKWENYTPDYLSSSLKGAVNGLAELDSNGLVPSAQLPSYVDDVLEYASLSAFPATGESGKIYVALDTNKTYRWSGSQYTIIGGDLTLGETSSTAYRGDRGKTAYDHSQVTNGNPHNVTATDVGLGNVNNTSDANKPVSIATQTELNKKQNIFQYDTMPTASSTNEGEIVQFTGLTTQGGYTNGFFYKCVDNNGTYEWQQTSTQPTGSMTLSGLDDVVVTQPTNNQVLKYNSTLGKWVNGNSGGAGDDLGLSVVDGMLCVTYTEV